MSHSGNSGTLIIVVRRAKDLPNKRKMEKQNPYCLLRISNLTDKTQSCIRGGQTPGWDEEFRFAITPEIQPILKISVLDETKKAPVFISEAEIDFTPAFYASAKEGYDSWFPLLDNGREAGEIYLETTFYPTISGSNGLNSSMNSAASKKTFMIASSSSNGTRKRDLPPIPGLETSNVQDDRDVYEIPPPIPRATDFNSNNNTHEPSSYDSFNNSVASSKRFDAFQPGVSINNLPDVPMHHQKTINHHESDIPSPYSNQPPPSNPRSPQKPKYHIVTGEEENFNLKFGSEEDPYLARASQLQDLPTQPIQPPPSSPKKTISNPLESLTKKFAAGVSFFGNKTNNESQQSKTSQSSNPFDELEREVQSDWAKNNQARQHQNQNNSSSSSPKKKAPPVPSHGSFNSSGTSSHMSSVPLPPIPQHGLNNTKSSSISSYNIIEPGSSLSSARSSGNQRSGSPIRKKPSNIPTSPRLMDIPFDALAIGNDNNNSNNNYHDFNTSTRIDVDKRKESYNVHDPIKPFFVKEEPDKSDEFLEEFNAPTPYEMFVKNAALNKSGTTIGDDEFGNSYGNNEISSRFNTSLPPLPRK